MKPAHPEHLSDQARRSNVVPFRSRRTAHLSEPALRGYHVAYREGETNHCPGCGRTHWYVGRQTAECASCATALPIIGARP